LSATTIPTVVAATPAVRKFYELTPDERVERLLSEGRIDEHDAGTLRSPGPLAIERADHLIESVVGVFPLPLGIAQNVRVNGRDYLVPMAIEEASVVAAASNGAKLLRAGGGIAVECDASRMVGQIQVLDVPSFEAAAAALTGAREKLLAEANARHQRLLGAGGGARRFEVRALEGTEAGDMLVVELEVDVRDAMGANVVNSMCEEIAPLVQELTRGRIGLRILTNLCDRRCVRATGQVPAEAVGGAEGVRGIVEASIFAEVDPYRAATHNKGIMNGVDAVLLATGQDWRAAEAGAHAFAARSGKYGALATWRRDAAGSLVGRLEMPLAVGTVGGGINVHPTARVARKILGAHGAAELAAVAAAVGLAQNLAAIRALAQEGIQRGHMELHKRARESR
jgi:hydroxymethylglutaryl-CoA reductase